MDFRLTAPTVDYFPSVPRNQLLNGFRIGDHPFCARSDWTEARDQRGQPGLTPFTGNEKVGKRLTNNSFEPCHSRRAIAITSAQRIIAKFGGQTRLAGLIGRRQSTVQHWARSGFIPARWHQKILDLATEKGICVSPAEFAAIVVRG